MDTGAERKSLARGDPCAIGVAVRKGDEAPGGIDKKGGAAAESFETATGLAGKRGKKKRGSGKAGKR